MELVGTKQTKTTKSFECVFVFVCVWIVESAVSFALLSFSVCGFDFGKLNRCKIDIHDRENKNLIRGKPDDYGFVVIQVNTEEDFVNIDEIEIRIKEVGRHREVVKTERGDGKSMQQMKFLHSCDQRGETGPSSLFMHKEPPSSKKVNSTDRRCRYVRRDMSL